MKKVGIITVHHYHNYGSALQAYATQRIFEKLGYDAYIIDYRSPEIIYATDRYMDYDSSDDSYYRELENKKHRCGLMKKWIKGIFSLTHLSYILYRFWGIRIAIDLFSFWLKNMHLTRRYDTLRDLQMDPPIFDIYVVGGDQLWNTHITYNNPAYYLTFARGNAKKIAFATSIGIPAIPEAALASFKKGVSNLSSILLREEEGVEYLRYLGYHAERVLDPTFMLSKKEWSKMQNREYCIPYSRYVLAYFLDPTDWTTELVREVSKQTSLPIIVIGGKTRYNLDSVFYTGSIEVSSFLTLFAHAEVVVTNSFHGMAFTLLFEKKLVATFRGDDSEKSMNSRHRNIVDLFNISFCLHKQSDFLPADLKYEMDYSAINILLNKYREDTFSLLKSALE